MFPEVDYRAQEVQLAPGDKLVFYSDGVTECRNRQGEAFGEAQLRASLNFAAQTGLSLTAVLEERLQEWRGPSDFEDDISLLVLERPLTLSSLNDSGESSATSGSGQDRPIPRIPPSSSEPTAS